MCYIFCIALLRLQAVYSGTFHYAQKNLFLTFPHWLILSWLSILEVSSWTIKAGRIGKKLGCISRQKVEQGIWCCLVIYLEMRKQRPSKGQHVPTPFSFWPSTKETSTLPPFISEWALVAHPFVNRVQFFPPSGWLALTWVGFSFTLLWKGNKHPPVW